MESNPYTPPPAESTAGMQPKPPSKARGGARIGLLSVVVGIVFAVWTVSISSGITPFVLTIAGWVICPYLIIALTGFRISSFWAIVLLGVAVAALAAFGAWAFDQVDEDAQGGLVLLFAPAYQIAGAIVAGFLILIVNKFTASR
jgi:hypothetical protein